MNHLIAGGQSLVFHFLKLTCKVVSANINNYNLKYPCTVEPLTLKGHLWNKDTSLMRTVSEVPIVYFCVQINLWNKDTSLVRTHLLGPVVSTVEMVPPSYIIYAYVPEALEQL